MTSDARAYVAEQCEEALVLEPDFYDEALVGVVERINFGPVACYDWDKLVEVATKEYGDHETAVEHLDFNVLGSLAGEGYPVVLHRPLFAGASES